MMQQDPAQAPQENLAANKPSPEDKSQAEFYDIPPLPGQGPRRPLLEKSERHFGEVFFHRMRQRDWHLPGKWFWLLVLGLALLLGFILFHPASPQNEADEISVTWRPLQLVHLQKNSYQILSGEDGLLDRLNLAFRLDHKSETRGSEKFSDQSKLVRAEIGNPASPLVFKANDQADFSLEDSLLQLKVLLAQRNKKAFLSSQADLLEEFSAQLGPDAPSSNWPAKLAYLRLLFLGSQYWSEDALTAEIDRVSHELLPLFEHDLKLAHAENFEEIMPSLLSSNEKEEKQSDLALEVVRLDQIDLWVLEALASLDHAWQAPADEWKEIVKGARLDSGFYAYAWDPTNRSYVPSAGATFQADTLSSLIQIRQLWEVGEGRADDLLIFNQLLLASGQFYQIYNQVSLVPAGNTISIPALLAYKELSLLAGQDLSLDLANRSLRLQTRGDSIPSGQGFLYRPGQEDTYYFQDNYQNLLLSAWELSLSEIE